MKRISFIVVFMILCLFISGCNQKDVMEEEQTNVVKQTLITDDGIFSKYYDKAYDTLEKMTLDEKISQILLVRYPDINQKEILNNYQFGGYIFFARNFKDKTKEEIIYEIKELQNVSKIPILTAVDEEGGIVTRVSSNKNLRNERFSSPRELYENGGINKIKEDNIEKNILLKELGINLNLAPVVDIATNESDYMYSRSIGQNKKVTSEFAKTIIKSSKNSGVSNSLKHFPGYGNNADTHNGISIDTRSYEEIMNNDIYPFKEGIKAGAESILVSHNIVNSIDSENPASLSTKIHSILRNKLGFTGIIITDDLDMGAINNTEDSTVKAIISGNDLIITTDYIESINSIKSALTDSRIKESDLDKLVLRVLAWKYYKKMM